jgi:hypothetical protein
VPQFSASEVEAAIGKLKGRMLPGTDQIPAEMIQGGGGGGNLHTLRSTNLLSSSGTKKNRQNYQWKESTVVPTHKKV